MVREDVVRLLFEAIGTEDVIKAQGEFEDLLGIAETAGKKSDDSSKSMMEMFARSELLGKAADAGKVLLGVFMNCLDASMEFQTSLAKLETIADTNAAPMENLSADLLALSSDTGVAVTSLTESAYQAISASVDTAGAVEFVAQANELAVGGFTSTETAVDVLSTAINAYGLEVSEAGQLSDYLITTQLFKRRFC